MENVEEVVGQDGPILTTDEPVSPETGGLDDGASTLGEEGSAAQPSSPPDYAAQIKALESKLEEQHAQLQRFTAGQFPAPRQGQVPQALYKPRDQWTVEDLHAVNDWRIEQRVQQLAAEGEARYQLSDQVLGEGNGYDTVITKYLNPVIEQSPDIAPFIQQLPARDRYMLGLLHEIYAKAGGDIVRAVKAIRGGLGSQLQAHRDLEKKVNQAANGAALKLVRGGGSIAGDRPLSANDIAKLSDADFKKLMDRATG